LKVPQLAAKLEECPDQVFHFVFVDAFWCLGSAPISAVEQSQPSRAFGVLLAVEAIDVFEIPIEVEEEFCITVLAMWCLLHIDAVTPDPPSMASVRPVY
jgi:hypothetical protein